MKKLLSWNINGIRAAQKKGFLDWFKKEKQDILCLQEIKAKQEQLDNELIDVNGYKSFWNSAERKGYSGVVVYTKEEPKEVKNGFGIKKFDSEGRTLILDYEDFVFFYYLFSQCSA